MYIIENNPFRVLGVYSNARQADIVRNVGKIKAFLNVGKTVEFPSDMNTILSELKRSAQSVQNAQSAINLPNDRIRYALFWFCNDDPIDSTGLNNLVSGDSEKAKSIFTKRDSYSSLVNRAVLSLIQSDYSSATIAYSSLIHDYTFRGQFCAAICGDTFQISEDALSHLLIDELLKEEKAATLLQLVTNESDKTYLREKAIEEPLSLINHEIAKAKSVAATDASASLHAGRALAQNTRSSLASLRQVAGFESLQYQSAADNLAKQILQCGINYFNNSIEYDAASHALELQAYAESIAIGQLIKDRCKKNTDILRRIIKDLPPKSVISEDRELRSLVSKSKDEKTISEAIGLLQRCAPYLIQIKEKLGAENEYYRDVSTHIASFALEKVVVFINSAGRYVKGDVYTKGLKAIKDIEVLDTTEQFKIDRLAPNKRTLLNILSSRGIATSSISSDLDLRTDDELFKACKSAEDYQDYLNKYPDGKHKEAATENLIIEKKKHRKSVITSISVAAGIIGLLFFAVFYSVVVVDNQDYEHAIGSQAGYESYLSSHPTGRHNKEAVLALYEFVDKNDPFSQDLFASKYLGTESGDLARKRADEIVDSLYSIAIRKDSQSGWEQYKSEVPESYYQETIWNKESSAWYEASSENSLDSYTQYLKRHPSGPHASAANKKKIDIQVDKIEEGSHDRLGFMLAPLPADIRDYHRIYRKTTEYEIENASDYTLYAYFSSDKQSAELVVPSKQTKSITLTSGSYRIAYVTYGTNAKPLFGNEFLNGEAQKSKFTMYTTTTRYRR